MNPPHQSFLPRIQHIAARVVAPVAVLVLVTGATAQDAVMSAPSASLPAPVLRDTGPQPQSRPADPAGAFFSFGSVSLHPHLMFRSIYGMGLPAERGRHVASMITTQAPGLRLDAGKHWTLDYTPTWTSYSAPALHDTLGHAASLHGAGQLQEWAVNWSENYNASSPILIETGVQTSQRSWVSQLGAARDFGSGLHFATSASLNERYGEISPDTRDWATMNWLTVKFSPRLEAGFGLGAGYTEIVAEPDSTNERYMARLNWSPTDKLTFSIDGGVEARHSRAVAAIDMNNPVLNAEVEYQPFAATKITLASSRTVTNSYFQKQVTESANWSVSLEQRLLGRIFLSTTYAHQESDYKAVTTATVTVPPVDPLADPAAVPPIVSLPGRSDRTESINARLTMQFLQRWSVAASYQRSNNRSNQAGFTFITTQFGLEVGCRF